MPKGCRQGALRSRPASQESARIQRNPTDAGRSLANVGKVWPQRAPNPTDALAHLGRLLVSSDQTHRTHRPILSSHAGPMLTQVGQHVLVNLCQCWSNMLANYRPYWRTHKQSASIRRNWAGSRLPARRLSNCSATLKRSTLLDVCVRKGHVDVICIVPSLSDLHRVSATVQQPCRIFGAPCGRLTQLAQVHGDQLFHANSDVRAILHLVLPGLRRQQHACARAVATTWCPVGVTQICLK